MCSSTTKLRQVLDGYAFENDFEITSLTSSKSTSINFASDVKRYQVEGRTHERNDTVKKHLVVKELPRNSQYAELYSSAIAFHNEHLAYSRILPELYKYSHKAIAAPHCVHSSDDLVIVEDLSIDEFKHLTPLNNFTQKTCRSTLSELANLHAASLRMKHQNGADFDTISSLTQELLYGVGESEEKFLQLQRRHLQIVTILVERFGKKDPQLKERSLQFLQDFGKRLHQVLRGALSRTNWSDVMNHGDVWSANLLFRDNAVKFLDFQRMKLCSPASDLAYFLYVNLDPDFRLAHQKELLDWYLAELRTCVRDLPDLGRLTKEWLDEEMRAFTDFGFLCGLWLLPVFYIDDEALQKYKLQMNEVIEVDLETDIGNIPETQVMHLLRFLFVHVESLNYEQ